MPATSFVADFIAGWTAGGAGLLIGHPLDTVKVRLQALKGYKSMLQCVQETLRHEAIAGFYKGMLFPFLSAGLLHSLYFGGHGSTVKLMKKSNPEDNDDVSSPFGHLICGSIVGGIFQWVPACPIEVAKTKLQVQKESPHHRFDLWLDRSGKEASQLRRVKLRPDLQVPIAGANRILFTSPLDCIQRTVRSEGIAGLYRGGFIMLIRDVIGFSLYLPVYEHMKSYLTPSKSTKLQNDICEIDGMSNDRGAGRHESGNTNSISHEQRLAVSLVAGGIAGVASWFPILPFDLIKSRLQADDIVQPKYKGILHCAMDSLQKDGISVFFRGWQVVVLRAFPVNAVLFLCYDETLRFLNRCDVLW